MAARERSWDGRRYVGIKAIVFFVQPGNIGTLYALTKSRHAIAICCRLGIIRPTVTFLHLSHQCHLYGGQDSRLLVRLSWLRYLYLSGNRNQKLVSSIQQPTRIYLSDRNIMVYGVVGVVPHNHTSTYNLHSRRYL